MASTSAPVLSCANCGRPESGPEKLLKPCTMCKSVSYCSRECKKAHYKQHKNVCAVSAQEHAKAAQPKPASRAPPKKDGHRGGLQKWQFDTWVASRGLEWRMLCWTAKTWVFRRRKMRPICAESGASRSCNTPEDTNNVVTHKKVRLPTKSIAHVQAKRAISITIANGLIIPHCPWHVMTSKVAKIGSTPVDLMYWFLYVMYRDDWQQKISSMNSSTLNTGFPSMSPT